MNPKSMPRERLHLPIAGLRKRRFRRPIRPSIELLEQRLMLSGDVPAEITVGRTLSSWTAAGIRDNQLQITYSVYNEQADELSGVLLATTLEPGVSFVTASQSPDSQRPGAGLEPGHARTVRGRERRGDGRLACDDPAPDRRRCAGLWHGLGRRRHRLRPAGDPAAGGRPGRPARLDPGREHDRPIRPAKGGRA